jgi:hypothetical protein
LSAAIETNGEYNIIVPYNAQQEARAENFAKQEDSLKECSIFLNGQSSVLTSGVGGGRGSTKSRELNSSWKDCEKRVCLF